MAAQVIGTRFKALRDERGLSQDDLARLFGFKDRQTVSAIETGARRVTAEELVLAVERLGVPLDYFTDPFQLVGEGRFSWRQTGVGAEQLDEYERAAGRWIAAFRVLAPQVGREPPLMRRALGLARHSRFDDAMLAGERFVTEFGLGDAPATALVDFMERELGVLVLMVDACDGISGAACRLPELDAVLIGRCEAEGRRHFALAHELFHILTWDAMPPEHSEEVRETGGNRVEQLANSFAAAVLMPASVLERAGCWAGLVRDELIMRLNDLADELHVTSSALRWRLAALGKLKPSAGAFSAGGELAQQWTRGRRGRDACLVFETVCRGPRSRDRRGPCLRAPRSPLARSGRRRSGEALRYPRNRVPGPLVTCHGTSRWPCTRGYERHPGMSSDWFMARTGGRLPAGDRRGVCDRDTDRLSTAPSGRTDRCTGTARLVGRGACRH